MLRDKPGFGIWMRSKGYTWDMCKTDNELEDKLRAEYRKEYPRTRNKKGKTALPDGAEYWEKRWKR